jgi:hypothetical protein
VKGQQQQEQQAHLRSNFDRFSRYYPMQQAGSVVGMVLTTTSQVLKSHTVRKTLATGLRTSARAIRSEVVTKRISASLETAADVMEEGSTLDHLATAVGSLSGALSDYVANYSHEDARTQQRRWEALQVAGGAVRQSMETALGFTGRVLSDERTAAHVFKLTSVSLGVIDHISQSPSAARLHDISVGLAHKVYTNEGCRRVATLGATSAVAIMQSPVSLRSKEALHNIATGPTVSNAVSRVLVWYKSPNAQAIVAYFSSATSATTAVLFSVLVSAMDSLVVPVLWGRRVLQYFASRPVSSHRRLAACLERESAMARTTSLQQNAALQCASSSSKGKECTGTRKDDVASEVTFDREDTEYLDRLLRTDREARRALIRLHLEAVEREKTG